MGGDAQCVPFAYIERSCGDDTCTLSAYVERSHGDDRCMLSAYVEITWRCSVHVVCICREITGDD